MELKVPRSRLVIFLRPVYIFYHRIRDSTSLIDLAFAGVKVFQDGSIALRQEPLLQ